MNPPPQPTVQITLTLQERRDLLTLLHRAYLAPAEVPAKAALVELLTRATPSPQSATQDQQSAL
jgi:hypothetical protein